LRNSTQARLSASRTSVKEKKPLKGTWVMFGIVLTQITCIKIFNTRNIHFFSGFTRDGSWMGRQTSTWIMVHGMNTLGRFKKRKLRGSSCAPPIIWNWTLE
jgi:hypothetical protein